MNNNEQLLKNGGFGKLLVQLSIPAVVIMVVMVIYNMADVFFIGQLGDPYMIAAVGLAGPVFAILSGLGTLLGSGGCTVISLALGRNDRKQIHSVSAFCFYGSLITGIIYTAIVLLLLKPLCVMLGAGNDTLGYTMSYMRIITLFAPVSMFANVHFNLIRADGAAKQSMIANIAGTITNLILDPVMILILRWGVSGAALATGIGNIVSAGYVLYYISGNKDIYSRRLSDALPDRETVSSVLKLGIPVAVSTILMSFSHIISNKLLVSHDTIAVAAQSIAGRVSMLNSMIAMGICMGMQPAISYNFAAKNESRTVEVLKKTCITAVIVSAMISVICFIFRNQILAAFIDDPSVIEIGRIALIAGVAVGPFYAVYQMATTFFQATARAGYATLCSLLNKGIYYIPVLFILDKALGMYGILFTAAVTDTISMFTALILAYHSVRNKGL